MQQRKIRPENVQLMAEHALCCSGNHSKDYPSSLVCTPERSRKNQRNKTNSKDLEKLHINRTEQCCIE